jgi:hypothetical protein
VLLDAEVGKDGEGRGLGLQFALFLCLVGLESMLVQKLVRLCCAQHKRTYVASEVMLRWRE